MPPTSDSRLWDGAAAELLAPDRQGRYVVVGGSGTGKTSLLVDIVAARIAAGASTESVLVLTGSARASADLRSRISAAVFERRAGVAIREPMVRTVHSYAFAVLAARAAQQGNPLPRLITAAEQDSIVRELLCGNAEDSSGSWPESLRPALTTAGFATGVRDLMARCTERGVDPAALRALGRRHNRPEWVAVADLARQYEEVMLLRSAVGMAAPQATVPALGAAELVGSALEAFAVEPGILAAEQDRIDILLVDDSQHLDPQAALLARLLAQRAGICVIAGDPNQSVFGFRGADVQLLQPESSTATTIELSRSHRCAAPVAALANAVARRLPGSSTAREIVGAENAAAAVRLAAVPTETAEVSLVVDLLRRSHLIDGVPWSQMAVIVRSVSRSGAALRRALQSAGVPVHAEAYDGAVASVPAVHALLLAVSAAQGSVGDEEAVALATGPIGRVDPVALRRLRRQLLRAEETRGGDRSSAALLRAVIVEADDTHLSALTDIQAAPLRRVRAVIASARDAIAAGASVLDVLWAAWSRSGLQRRWDGLSQRGGPLGAQADRDLDAMSALFDLASEHVSRTPGIGVTGLIDHIRSLALAGRRATLIEPDAVTIVSAHSAVGRQWDVVAIPGVQEGLWPNTSVRGGVLRTQELMDVLAGIDHAEHVDGSAVALAEERRLLLLAVGRAGRRVLLTAVDNENADMGGGPAMASRFLTELMVAHPDWVMPERRPGTAESRTLTAANLVGELRAVVTAAPGSVSDGRRRAAARQLARLADAGVSGADPESWYGLADVSSQHPLWHAEDGPVRLSPSNVETLMACPLRWLLERHGGTDLTDPRRALGTLVHALVGEYSGDADAMRRELDKAWETMPFESKWYARNELLRHQDLLQTFSAWRAATRGELTEVGREIGVDGVLTRADHPQVRLVGRIDRLERDAAGRPVIIDIKTGKSPATKDDAQQHAQLATYQVAAADGLIDGQPAGEPGGGRLVYVAKSNLDDGATQRHQDPLTPAAQDTWRETIHTAAANTQGPVFIARINDGCGHCPLRACCPAQAEGQAVCQS
ncbi:MULTISPECIES: ATP-dependent DNA helicase [unclassified Mycobacteroides]|uniref:ATP-dependent DNA helicase n=1 Tax=unclassified Mycobacteroides TaxID=2618759 RepID=UPI001321F912|nr:MULTISPECIES: ATP-dependent DNA helicase [unclassified Mycobacteroides]MUM16542.1 ATP-dependent DNA helicase [Mycobacteroides sp. CBMA 326]